MFWQVLFWVLLVPVLIVMGIVYGTSKQLYKLFQILATYTYIITIAYVIDVFDLSRDWILALLTLSAILLLILGYQLTKRHAKEPVSSSKRASKRASKAKARRASPSRKWLWATLGVVLVMLVVIIVSGFASDAAREVSTVESVSKAELFNVAVKGNVGPSGVNLATLTYTNDFFLPVVIQDEFITACWYSTSTREVLAEDLQILINGAYSYQDLMRPFGEVPPGGTVARKLTVGQIGVPYAVPGTPEEKLARDDYVGRYAAYDAVLLVASADMLSCSDVAAMRADGKLSLDITIPLRE